ncbi:hypothetical protein [Lacticaseibacillus zhaodongensis]|uniref:hypothetical protein n=1 Tax=Lacticaseibacillus zhaodongensis TaxID=2668065 RepID=UPI0012D340AD|nr:hypothetical protein [Lacticaseibacillus zhaodongensis]
MQKKRGQRIRGRLLRMVLIIAVAAAVILGIHQLTARPPIPNELFEQSYIDHRSATGQAHGTATRPYLGVRVQFEKNYITVQRNGIYGAEQTAGKPLAFIAKRVGKTNPLAACVAKSPRVNVHVRSTRRLGKNKYEIKLMSGATLHFAGTKHFTVRGVQYDLLP